MSFFSELHRRNVFRVGAAYVVTAWLLIEVAETIFPLFGFDETPARIVVVVLAIGLVPTLVLAWAFEWTPEGLKRDADVDRSLPVTVDNARRLDRVIMAVLALALGVFAFDKFVLDPARDAEIVEGARQEGRADAIVEAYGERSIAVLPFVNMSADPGQEYFSDGMAEELLNLLARIPDLRVISRSSAFTYKDKSVPIPTIATELGVSYIVEGSVRKGRDTVRITAQLIEARSDRHLWSETYDRKLEDVFAIQDEISAAIAGKLEAALGLDVGDPPYLQAQANTEVYEAYLRGKYLMAQRTLDSLAAAVEEFAMAIELDPDYAPAHAELAIATQLLNDYGGLERSEADARARPHAERALELDPGLAEAHAAMGHVSWASENLAITQEHFRRAIERNPNYAEAHLWLGNSLGHERRYLESFAFQKKAAQLDPLSIAARGTFFLQLIWRGRLDEAKRELDKMASLNPEGFLRYGGLVALNSLGGNWADGALASLNGIQSGNLEFVYSLLRFCALMGLESEASADVADMGFDHENAGILEKSNPVLILLWFGKPAEAITAFERIFGEDFPHLQLIHGRALAGAGEYNPAGPLLEEVWQFMDGRIGVPYFDSRLVLALMAARRESGGEAGIAELELALSDAVRRYDEAGLVECDALRGCVHFDRGISAYLAGNRDEGLAWIAKAVDSGYFIPPNHAYLQFLYDDPGFAPIREKQKARQASEREKFLSVICEDNPYADVWQPAEGTCEAYASND